MSRSLVREEITRFEDFAELREQWNDLLERSNSPNHYMLHEWLAAFWAGFGNNQSLHVVVVRERGRLIACAPFALSRSRLSGIPVRALHSLDLDHSACDFILNGQEDLCLRQLVTETLRRTQCDVVIIRGVRDGTTSESILQDVLQTAGVRYHIRPHREVYLDVSGGMEVYEKGLRAKFRSNVRNRGKRLSNEGEVEYARYRTADRVFDVLAEVFDVSLRSWKGLDGSAIGLQESYRVMFTRLVELLGHHGQAEMCLLRVNGKAIAYRIGFRAQGVFFEADIAFDLAWKRFSPGVLLAMHNNRQLIEEGVNEINMGMYFPWKDEWSPAIRMRNEYVLYNRGIVSHVARVARGVRNRLTSLRSQFKNRAR